MRRLTRRQFMGGVLAAGAGLAIPGCGHKRASDKVVLTYNTFWTGLDAHAKVMDWLYQEFRKRHPDIDFQVVQSAGGAQDNGQKLMAELAAGGGPDVLHDTTYDHVRPGYLLDLTPVIAPWRDRFYPEALASCTWGGKVFSLPTEFSMVPCIWNAELLKSVEKGVPKTFEEYMDLGRALKKKSISLTSFSTSGGHIFFSILFGHPDAVPAIKREEWESEPFQQAVEVLQQIRQEGFVPDNDIELQFAGGASLFQIGRLGHYMNGAWTIINEITAQGVDPKLRDHVEFTPFPAYHGTQPIRAWVATKTALNGTLADKPEKLKAAVAFLELFTSPKTAPRFARDAHSPEGVKLDLTEEMAGPLLYRFMVGSRKMATHVFALPSEPWKFSEQSQTRAIPDMLAAINEGATAKKALSVFAEVLRS